MKRHEIAPMGVMIEQCLPTVRRTLSIGITQEDAYQSTRQFLAHCLQRHELTRTGRALHFEFVAVVVMKFLQRLYQ